MHTGHRVGPEQTKAPGKPQLTGGFRLPVRAQMKVRARPELFNRFLSRLSET